MQLADEAVADLVARLRRVEGQVRGLQRMIEEGRDCEEVVTQFAAATKAFERAAFKYFSTALAECVAGSPRAAAGGYDRERMERLFLKLS